MVEEFIDQRLPHFYIDASRRAFIQDTEITLKHLVADKLRDMSSFRRLLLGRKGVGKSLLLQALGQAAASLFPPVLVTVTINYSNARRAPTPVEAIRARLGGDGPSDVPSLDAYLRDSSRFVFLIIDEFDNVYTGACPRGKDIIGELMEIGDSREGRIHCILSGSSNRLRQLCFAKLPHQEWEEFPNYTRSDMNSTKFSARWIFPFLDWKDFLGVATKRCFRESAPVTDDGERMARAYIETSGNIRLMEDFFRHGKVDAYSLGLRHAGGEEMALLGAVYACVTSFQPASTDFAATHWTMYIPLSAVRFHLREKKIDLPSGEMAVIYNLADRGHLRYDDQFFAEQGPLVSLGSTLLFLELAKSGHCDLTPREATALLFPNGHNHLLAEQVALRFLALNAPHWIGQQLRHPEVNELCLKSKGQRHEQLLSSLPPNLFVGRLWKEVPDAFGADALLAVHADDANPRQVITHRIQVKLGTSSIKIDEAQKIFNRFHSMQATFKIALMACDYIVADQIFYLVTTRSLLREATEYFEQQKIRVVGQKVLREKVWPSVVRSLGKPFS